MLKSFYKLENEELNQLTFNIPSSFRILSFIIIIYVIEGLSKLNSTEIKYTVPEKSLIL